MTPQPPHLHLSTDAQRFVAANAHDTAIEAGLSWWQAAGFGRAVARPWNGSPDMRTPYDGALLDMPGLDITANVPIGCGLDAPTYILEVMGALEQQGNN